jgi:two-component system invasion response regulator UvrY
MKNISEIKIAIADDYPIVRKGVIDVLKDLGINNFSEVSNGYELLKEIEACADLPEICILDIHMPKMDGYEAIKILNKKWPQIKILVFTMFFDEYSITKMISNGAKGYILKDSPINEILKAIYEIHHFGFYFSEQETNLFLNWDRSSCFEKYNFNQFQFEFIKYCCTELAYKEIADKMHISLNSVECCREEVFSKLQLKTRVGLAMFAIRSGLVSV